MQLFLPLCLLRACACAFEIISWDLGRLEMLEGEAQLLQGLHWALDLQLTNVIFELDAKLVVDAIHANVPDFSEFGSIIPECRKLLFNHPNFLVKFVRRQANVVAHSLARVATSYPSPMSLMFFQIVFQFQYQ